MDGLSPNGRKRVYRVLLRVSRADGRIDPGEEGALTRMRRDLGLGEDEARAIETEQIEKGIRLGKSDVERRAVARMMVELALADGDLALSEFKLLQKVARGIGLPEENLIAALRRAEAAAKAAGLRPTHPVANVPQGGIVTDDLRVAPDAHVADPFAAQAWPQADQLLARLQGPRVTLAQAARAAVELGFTGALLRWGLGRLEPVLFDRELSSAGSDAGPCLVEVATAIQAGWGWVARPDWPREVQVRAARAALSSGSKLPVDLGGFDLAGDPTLGPAVALLIGLLLAIEASELRGELRELRLEEMETAFARVPPRWFDAQDRARIGDAAARMSGGALPPVDPRIWRARLDRWLHDDRTLVEARYALPRLAQARPEIFGRVREEVTRCFPIYGTPLAGFFPGIAARKSEASEEHERVRCQASARAAAARFGQEAAPAWHERDVPLRGEGIERFHLILDEPRDAPLAQDLVAWLQEHLDHGARLVDGQTLEYVCFRLRIRLQGGELRLEAPDLRGFVPARWTPSLSDALRTTALQGAVADAFDFDVVPARLDRPALVSLGSEATPVQLVRCAPEDGFTGFELRPGGTRSEPPVGIDPVDLPRQAELNAAREATARDSARPVSLWEVAAVCPHMLPFLAMPVGAWATWSSPQDLPWVGFETHLWADAEARLREAFSRVAARCGRQLDPSWLDGRA